MKIFINYRRESLDGADQNFVNRLKNFLSNAFPPQGIFLDSHSIPPASHFDDVIKEAINTSDVMLSVIGENWLQTLKENEASDSKDFVVDEITHAISNKVAIVPVIVERARLPREADLPESIRGMLFRNAIHVRIADQQFENDLGQLVESLSLLFRDAPAPPETEPMSYLPPLLEKVSKLDSKNVEEVLNAYSNLIELFDQDYQDSPEKERSSSTYLEYLWGKIENCDENIPIFGSPGIGKSTLIALLAIYASKIKTVACDYINLHFFDDKVYSKVDVAKSRIREELVQRFKTFENQSSDRKFYLFVDGFNGDDQDRWQVQYEILEKLKTLQCVHIVGWGKDDDQDSVELRKEPQISKLPPNHSFHVSLKSLPIKEHAKPVRQYVELENILIQNGIKSNLPSASDRHQDVLTRVKKAGLNRIDLLRLVILAEAGDSNSQSIGSAVTQYVKEQIHQHAQETNSDPDFEPHLIKMAEYVYRTDVGDSQKQDAPSDLLCWSLLTRHKLMRSYCQAFYIINSLANMSTTDVDNREKQWEETGLKGKIFPQLTNLFCKHLLVEKRDQVIDALDSLLAINLAKVDAIPEDKALDETSLTELAKLAGEIIHFAYLLGRFRSRKDKADELLRSVYKSYFDKRSINGMRLEIDIKRGDFAKLRMLEATILISQLLITSSHSIKREKSEKFLTLLRDDEWRDIVCGFHLEYHGDAHFYYDVSLHFPDKKDNLAPYTRVLDAVEKNIKKSINMDKPHPLFSVEVAIVCALANARQQNDELRWSDAHNKCREKVRELIGQDIRILVKKEPVIPFMKMTEKFLRTQTPNSAFSLISKMYEMKFDTCRAGWITKLNMKGRIESVADHTWSAMLLAEVLLPNDPPPGLEDKYSKDRIIRILLVHDIAESITGDRPLSGDGANREGENEREEKHISELFEWMSALDGIHGCEDMTEKWSDAESNVSPVNGSLARFFDKLDALYQLTIYSKIAATSQVNIGTVNRDDWVNFFNTLCSEAEEVVNRLPDFFTECGTKWIDWARREFESGSKNLAHEIMFESSQKYYPRLQKHIKRSKSIWREFDPQD
ncbi:MAG: hypothetical protein C9356_09285 [Oleiphilus sp.]|nr:MAG: hypothetical protein C9356_09285 [Oleiphilus sp.]